MIPVTKSVFVGSVNLKLKEMGWDVLLLILLTLGGWAYTAGQLKEEIQDTKERLVRVETKLDDFLLEKTHAKKTE